MEPLRLDGEKRCDECLKLLFARSESSLVVSSLWIHPLADVEESENFLDVDLLPFVRIEVLHVVLQCPCANNEVVHSLADEAKHVEVPLVVRVSLPLEEKVMEEVVTRWHLRHCFTETAFDGVFCGTDGGSCAKNHEGSVV